jgi:hypothetical protein
VSRLRTTTRVFLGLLLLSAAGLKLYGLGISAVPRVGWFAQPWIQLAVAEWEIVVGLWLVSGRYPLGSWIAAAGTFVAFAVVSGYLGAAGVSSCGCLGVIHASPWLAFGLDLAALSILSVARPQLGSGAESNWLPFRVGLEWGIVAVVLMVWIVGNRRCCIWFSGSGACSSSRRVVNGYRTLPRLWDGQAG